MKQRRTLSTRSARPATPDRLNRVLTWVAIVLGTLVAVLGTDLWLSPEGAGVVTHAVHQTPPVTRPASSLWLAPSPAVQAPSPVPVTPPPCVPPRDWSIHVVQEGNTLYSLAQRYGTDVETLKLVNCLDTDTIVIAQELYVPPLPAVVPSVAGSAMSRSSPTIGLYDDFPDSFVNIVLLGSDKRAGSTTWRTDTMIVVSVDTESDFVRLLSIPRDLWVNIPDHGPDRMNTADLWGELAKEGNGPQVVKQTIYENLGIPIHYYVRVDFQGFMKIIDAVGGVDIDVECPLPDLELAPGMVHMDGEQALLYARSRISSNDFDRSRRQRKILMALWQQHLNAGLIPKLPALWKAMQGTFQTDLPLDQVIRLAPIGLRLKPNQILSQAIGPGQVQDWVSPGGAAVLLPLHDEIEALLTGFYAPPDTAFLEKINKTRIQVLNGSPRQDADLLAATALSWPGFQVTSTGLANSQSYTATQVIVYRDGEDIAQTVASQLEVPRTAIQYRPDPASPVDIQVILGSDYDPCAGK
jgi:polyisoprenyl-teichoic acid--peptidoglycan teichoic acid transferase